MRTSNLPSGGLQTSEIGLVWEERISGTNSSTTLELPQYSSFRVRAAASVTVTMNNVLAATMVSGEIIVFNVGDVNPDFSTKRTVTVTITGNCYVQTARVVEYRNPTIN